jgi:CubicO group peptidase (beta-lactamase class C family)
MLQIIKKILLILSLTQINVAASAKDAWLDQQDQLAKNVEQLISKGLADSPATGAAVVIIKDGKPVLRQGYGKTHALGGAVTPSTVFQAASLGKPATAYMALVEASQGRMALDAPLKDYLKSPWLDTAANAPAQKISMRHVLTHSSGLSNDIFGKDRKAKGAPGAQFSYSGGGFVYLQGALSGANQGASLDKIAERNLFAPLGMKSASFAHIKGRVVMGQLPGLPILLGGLLATALIALLGGGGYALYRRWRVKSWAFGNVKAYAIGMAFVSIVLAGIAAAAAGPELGFPIGIALIAITLFFILCAVLVRRFLPRSWSGMLRTGTSVAVGVAAVVALASQLSVPVNPVLPNGGNAAFSLMISAEDYGKFLAEETTPTLLPAELVAEARKPSMPVTKDIAWSILAATETDDHGKGYFQWGSNPGFGAFTVFYPDQRDAIVVFTNGQGGEDLGRELARNVFGSEAKWQLPNS